MNLKNLSTYFYLLKRNDIASILFLLKFLLYHFQNALKFLVLGISIIYKNLINF
jgi:hypothetical protein